MKYVDLKDKNVAELTALVTETRAALQAERFKDRFTKKPSVIKQAKMTIARAQTALMAKVNNQ